ncbi:transporter [Pontibacter roseus]|uniref:transporter n=1 Tax=Pontibacter roseus TaxID=336989 RepID=UPI00036C74C6|nr:transporter [Pontibacter roseus]
MGQGEEEKISSDRPDQSQGPTLVPRHTLQFEAGYLYQRRRQDGLDIRTSAYPTALLRIGLAEKVELRLQGAMKDSVIENGARRRLEGFGPLSIGAKIHLWEESGWRPEAALAAMLALPVASRIFRPDNVEPQFNLGLANALSEKLDLTYNLGYGWTGGNPVPSYGANIERELSDKLTVYLEAFGSKEKGEPAEHMADVGLLLLVLPNLQLDLAAGRGLSKAAPDYFVTAGFSGRLPR